MMDYGSGAVRQVTCCGYYFGLPQSAVVTVSGYFRWLRSMVKLARKVNMMSCYVIPNALQRSFNDLVV